MFGSGVSPLNVADMELSVPSAADPELPASTGTRNSESAAFAVCNSGSAALGEEGCCRLLQICCAREHGSIPAASAEHNSISAAPGTGALTAAPDLPNSVTGGARSAAPGDANLQTSRAWLPAASGHAPAHGGRTRAVMPTPLGRMGKDRRRFRRRTSITHPSTAYA